MEDQSYLDKKYFIDDKTYNCPFCNRRNVVYTIEGRFEFNWSQKKACFGHLIQCSSCNNTSMHLSYENITSKSEYRPFYRFLPNIDIDSKIFYSHPTSFFVIDNRIPSVIRELITEAEGCLKMNFLTGASACARKAIYELLRLEQAEGPDYESKIKSLKDKYPNSDPDIFDNLSHIQYMSCDVLHEESWEKWDSETIRFIIEMLKTILYDVYVIPRIKEERRQHIQKLRESVTKGKKGVDPSSNKQ